MTTPNVTLTLTPQQDDGQDPFQFTHLEIPAEIKTGGEQLLAVHKLVGGARIIDAMGADDMALEWHGIFLPTDRYGDPLPRARRLDNWRQAGTPLWVEWSEFRFLAVIKHFEVDFQRAYQLPYKITLEIVSQADVTDAASIDTALNDDVDASLELTQELMTADVPHASDISGAMAQVQEAIGTVKTWVGAAQSAINSVLQPLNQAAGYINQAISTYQQVRTLVSMPPGQLAQQLIGLIAGQSADNSAMVNLLSLQALVGRMRLNLGAASAGASLTAIGGNLFQVASKAYGDATAWTTIAKASGVADPFVQGLTTLNVPRVPDAADGVLSA